MLTAILERTKELHYNLSWYLFCRDIVLEMYHKDAAGLINCYAYNQDGEADGNFYIKIENEQVAQFISRIRNKSIKNIKQYVKEDFTLLVVEVPSIFRQDYKLFLEGKYTKYSDRAKSMILDKQRYLINENILSNCKNLYWSTFDPCNYEIDMFCDELEVPARYDMELMVIPDKPKETIKGV